MTPDSTNSHVYELRIYTANEGKLEALQARFRDHTIQIFNRYNLKSVGYWVPTDPPYAGNAFIYILEHPSREEAARNWAAFSADPEWQSVRKESELNGPLVAKIERIFMTPTAFSAMR